MNLFAHDLSTAVLLEKDQVYTHSAAILGLFPHMGFPYSIMGPFLLAAIPKCVRDFAYCVFARHRGTIWKCVKRVTGIGAAPNTVLYNYRDRILGLENEKTIPASWGFQPPEDSSKQQ
jgi:DCC1-like thiol-disulfide oxidoreductase